MSKKRFYFAPIIITAAVLVVSGCSKESPVSPITPYAPTYCYPPDGAADVPVDSLVFCWTVVTSGPTTYTIQVSKNNLFTTMVVMKAV